MAKNLGGRPYKEIDKAQFENLCALQCTKSEICAWFDVTDKTLERWCKRTYGAGFSEVFAAKRGKGVISVRRALYQNAVQKGNVKAQIFWLKNHGGMTDKITGEFSEKQTVEATVNTSIENASDRIRALINEAAKE